jgi:hypothetical protein
MKRLLFFGFCLSALVGCGGGGGSGTLADRSPTEQTRTNVAKTQTFIARGMSHGGMQTPNQADKINGLPPAPMPGMGPGPNGGPAPMIGGFIRHLKPPALGMHGRGDDPSNGGGGSDPGPDDPPIDWSNFYYDEWLGLWVQVTFDATSYRNDFYVDEEKTRPAGYMVSTWPETWDQYPVTYRSDYEFTAGTLTGSRGYFVSTMTSEMTGSMSYDSLWDGDRYRGESTWSAEGSSWTNRTDNRDGSWSSDRGTFAANGSGSTVSENSLGYMTRYTWNADGSGDGRLEGPDPGLPAVIRWNERGEGTITWADGTVEEFHWWIFVGNGDGAVKRG